MEHRPVRLTPDPTKEGTAGATLTGLAAPGPSVPGPATLLAAGARVIVREATWFVDGVHHHGNDALVDLLPAGGQGGSCTLLPHVERFVPGPDSLRRVSRRRARRVWLALRASACAPCRPLSPVGLDLAIVDYQLAPLMALLGGAVRRVLVADAVGLGKTIEAGLAVREAFLRRGRLRSLVLCPSTLVPQWLDELRLKLGVEATACDAQWLAMRAAALPTGMNPWSVEACLVASLDFVKQPHVLDGASRVAWDVVVVDEAHHVTRPTYRSSAADTLGQAAEWLLLLTATPHDGHDDTFARLLGTGKLVTDGPSPFADPVMFFRRTRERLGATHRRRTRALTLRLSEPEARLFTVLEQYIASVLEPSSAGHSILLAGVLRRRACSSAAALVRTVDRRLRLLDEHGHADGDAAQGLLFDTSRGEPDEDDADEVVGARSGTTWPRERAWLSRLRLAGLSAMRHDRKLTVLDRYLARTAPEPVVAFTEYRDTLVAYAQALAPRVRVAATSGAMPPAERTAALRNFHDGRARLLITTDVAAEGLNLHHRARLVVHIDLPWTPSRLEQRAGRVDRFGQRRQVHVLSLVRAHPVAMAQVERLHDRHVVAEAAQASADNGVGSTGLADRVDCPDALQAASAVVANDLGRQRVVQRQLAREHERQHARTASGHALASSRAFRRQRAAFAGVPCYPGRTSTRRALPREAWAVVETVVRRSDGYLVSRVMSAERSSPDGTVQGVPASVVTSTVAEPANAPARRAAMAARLHRRAREALRQPALFAAPGVDRAGDVDTGAVNPHESDRSGTRSAITRLVVMLPARDPSR